MNVEVLQELAARPEIQSMDAALQKPSLEKAAAAFNHMYLISTTDLTGFNIARNDQEAPKDYKDRAWFQGAVAGNPVTYQTLVGRTSGQPALVVSVPVRNPQGNIAGVLMFASDLGVLSNQVQASRIGKSGYAYVIDANNQVVAHPDRSYSAQLKDLSDYPPVVALRTGARGEFPFTDEQGVQWIANLNVLPNNWAVIVQAPRSELLSSVTIFEHISWLVLLVGSGLLFLMAWLTIRQGFRPVQTLSETVRAVSAGDLTRRAPIESQDEIGLLAQSFNNMAGQLQELISGLEQRVSDRTHQLERRAVELQVLAEVAREAAAIRDLEGLLEKTVHLISDRFGYDHAGIFLVDETGEYAVLRAASSTGGKRMLARGHRLRIGQMGIVGFVAANASPRIALDVGADAVYFDNPDLPDTRSEVGLPLIIHEKVIGVLDVQSMQPAAFSEEDLEIFQMLADQVAVAIENARLLTESQQALKELQSRYGAQVRQAWERRAANRALVFACDQNGVRPITDESAFWKGEVGHYLEAPVLLRDQQLGTLLLRREPGDGPWTSEEKDLITETISQVAQALENARLLNEVQQRAYHEQLVNEITTRAQSSLNIETVMKTAVEEIGRVVGASKIQVRLRAEAGSRNGS
jgi:GAF domain-containing protein/HAMP domain-containing protein